MLTGVAYDGDAGAPTGALSDHEFELAPALGTGDIITAGGAALTSSSPRLGKHGFSGRNKRAARA